jgi:ATP-dependent helicase/nuclease subunit A
VGEPQEKLPASQVIKAKSYLDWIGMAVARHPDGESIRQYGGCQEHSAAQLPGGLSNWEVTIIKAGDIYQSTESSQADNTLLAAVRRLEPADGGTDTQWVDALLNWQYSREAVVSKPAKLSVSEIKRRLELVVREAAEAMFVPKPSTVHARPRFLQTSSRLTPVEFGVLLHTVMQHIDLTGGFSEQDISEQTAALENRQILPSGQAAEVDTGLVSAFFASQLGRRLVQAKEVWREMPFSLLLPAEKFYPDLQGCGEQIFVQGNIDCLFAEDDGLVLIDYKTDYAGTADELVNKYVAQLSMYALAIERILGRPVKEQYIYAFKLGREIKLSGLG